MVSMDLPPALIAYMRQRAAERSEAVDVALLALTDRERSLVREAAVMGYVQGRRHPEGESHPKDSAVLGMVVDACFAFPDLYPVISSLRDGD